MGTAFRLSLCILRPNVVADWRSITGEIMVLALLPEDEGHGLGRLLLTQVVETLRHLGRQTLFLSC
ncbi:GNAT family N-acetyltransferase, partial [Kerstersia gyiorum]